ncbi:MAG: protein translocase subunit SecF, partial [bacterium]
MRLFKNPSIDFLTKRKIGYIISLSLIVVGILSLIIQGGPNYGIDFKGGTSVVIKFLEDITTAQLREALSGSEIANAEIKSFGARNEYLIYIEQQKGISAAQMAEKVQTIISESLSDKKHEIRQVETIGPKIGKKLRNSAIWAILIALLLILIYIGIRFELLFAVGAIVALFHDVFIILGIFSLLRIEISIKEIAAFLTIVGYSLNDTIVVYDRIRENLKILRREDLFHVLNKSINQCLSRTVITSVTTFIVVLILFLFGGEVLKGFSFAMLLGVVVGTYSSIFVASPIIFEWQKKHGGKN